MPASMATARLSICGNAFSGTRSDGLGHPNQAFGSTRSASSAYQ